MIEPTVHYFFHDLEALHPRHRAGIAATRDANEAAAVELWDDASAHALLQADFPHLAPLYRRIRIPAVRCDLARLAILHRHGGLYLDVTFSLRTDMRAICGDHDLILLRVDNVGAYRKRVESAHFANGFMGAVQGSCLMLDCLKRVHFNLATGFANYTVSFASGPQMLTECYFRAKDRLGNVGIVGKSQLAGLNVDRVRVDGVNNLWVEQQRDGIVEGAPGDQERAPQERAWKDALAS